eukprot:gnl/TRDRNA2_/TRDRNA2_177908_c1_seq2.p1 gnl/TRDRNA2_/TRDRNA2_177908_c1~~gnl/TRDRNA2_/TRDRNA2_177908_c1_seq2.p1  ORF type:complete len:317 (+),score=39.83 gnl/TRDRNA2_/TRDRNA2_177908_c1_seq2:55-1005(+)
MVQRRVSRKPEQLPAVLEQVTAQWKDRELPAHLFAVVRHTMRADATVEWAESEDARLWPLDVPLSDAGKMEAGDLGDKLRDFADDSNTSFHVVVTSPYFRCVQTAAEICKRLGSDSRMIVDRNLGEVFGPKVMGTRQPLGYLRPQHMRLKYCAENGVECQSRHIGQHPKWPEDVKGARRRYAQCLLKYLRRGEKARQNFVLVTHGDCVGAALSIMPCHINQNVYRVDSGGCFLAKRPRSKDSSNADSSSGSELSMRSMRGRHTLPDLRSVIKSQEIDEGAAAACDEISLDSTHSTTDCDSSATMSTTDSFEDPPLC